MQSPSDLKNYESFLAAHLLELRRDLSERERALASLLHHVETADQDLADRNALLAIAKAQLETLHQALTQRQEEFESLVTSRSWKLTAPVRLAGRALRRIKTYLTKGAGIDPPAERRVGSAGGGAEVPKEPIRQNGSSVPAASLHRAEILRRTLGETLGRVDGKTAEGRYVHRVVDHLDADKLGVKVIAFYVPEFYPDSQSHEWKKLGLADRGHFTTALPRYLDHYQPHLPVDLAISDQRIPQLTRSQIDLARQYGIYGFCFQSYWSRGGRLPNQPLEQFLADPSLDFHFCICCSNASEQWGTVDSGDESASWPTEETFIGALKSVLLDPRCIRIDGKPVLIIQRPGRLPDAAARVRQWRERAVDVGLPGLYVVAIAPATSNLEGPARFDAFLEDPLAATVEDVTSAHLPVDPNFRGHIYDYESLISEPGLSDDPATVLFRHVMTGSDSEAKRPRAGNSFVGASPALYARWLQLSCGLAMRNRPQERLLFVSAWNDWAEGAHLEPDRRFGYAYLHSTANVLRYHHHDPMTEKLIAEINAAFTPSSPVAIIFHCYYEDLITPIFDHYLSANRGADLFVTVRYDVSGRSIREMQSKFPNIYFSRQENRGRDIRPFLVALQQVRKLGYRFACKVHTKKTPQALGQTGELWREKLLDPLLGRPNSVAKAAEIFERDPHLGLLVPDSSVMDLAIDDTHTLNTFWLDRFLDRLDRRDLIGNYKVSFPAGSMYWFRVQAFAGLEELVLTADEFESELGQRDGTVAHAVERLVALYVQQRGYSMEETSGLESEPRS